MNARHIWILSAEDPWAGLRQNGVIPSLEMCWFDPAATIARAWAEAGWVVTLIHPGERNETVAWCPGLRLHSFVPCGHRWAEAPPAARPDAHPSYPANILDFQTALSFQMAGVVAALAATEGPPETIESMESRGLPYYLLQRQLLEADYLAGVPVLLGLHSPVCLTRPADHQPRAVFPHYWHGRLEIASALAAAACHAPTHRLISALCGVAEAPEWECTVISPPVFPAAARPAQVGTAHRLVYAGPLAVRAGLISFLRECRRLWCAGRTFEMVLAGPDDEYPARGTTVARYLARTYQKEVAEGRLLIETTAHPETLDDHLQRASWAIFPGFFDHGSPGFRRALSLGKPLLVSRESGLAELMGMETSGLQPGLAIFSWENEGEAAGLLAGIVETPPADASAPPPIHLAQRLHKFAPAAAIEKRLSILDRVRHSSNKRIFFPFMEALARRGGPVVPLSAERAGEPGLVSVVIPFFNLPQYIGEAVVAAAASDYRPIEIVVVDDGSDDPAAPAALERLADLAGGLPCRLVRQENAGLAAARNRGAEEARGEFILFCDADDRVEPSFAGRAVRIMRRWANVHLVYSWERYFGLSGDFWPNWNLEFPYLLAHNMCPSRPLVRRASFLAWGRQKSQLVYNFEDYESWLAMAAAGCGGVSIPEPLVGYRIRAGSHWQSSSPAQHLYLYETMAALHADLYRRFGPELFALLNANGPAHAWNRPAGNPPHEDTIRHLQGEIERWRGRCPPSA